MRMIGGPWDGDGIDGLVARVLLMHTPDFFCLDADGRWEHYVLHMSAGQVSYRHTGGCNEFDFHPDCGHDHTRGLG